MKLTKIHLKALELYGKEAHPYAKSYAIFPRGNDGPPEVRLAVAGSSFNAAELSAIGRALEDAEEALSQGFLRLTVEHLLDEGRIRYEKALVDTGDDFAHALQVQVDYLEQFTAEVQ